MSIKVEWRRLRDEQPEPDVDVWGSVNGEVSVVHWATFSPPALVDHHTYDEWRASDDTDEHPIWWAPMELPEGPEVGNG